MRLWRGTLYFAWMPVKGKPISATLIVIAE
jgi:hypothetical protein